MSSHDIAKEPNILHQTALNLLKKADYIFSYIWYLGVARINAKIYSTITNLRNFTETQRETASKVTATDANESDVLVFNGIGKEPCIMSYFRFTKRLIQTSIVNN